MFSRRLSWNFIARGSRFLTISFCHRLWWRVRISPSFLTCHLAIIEQVRSILTIQHSKLKLTNTVIKSCFTSEYYLTEIGLTGPPSCKGPFIYLPRDKNSAQICSRKIISNFDNARFRQFFLAGVEGRHSKHYEGKNMGFPFHAHCWEILGHILGKDTIEAMPGAIVRAAREYWRSGNIEYAPIWGIDHTMDFWQDGTYLAEYSLEGSLRLSWGLLYQKGINVFLSPWVVPGNQKAIKSARDQRAQASLTKSSYLGRLPIEVFLLVVEIVCPLKHTRKDISSMRNMLCVSDLEVPECFWKSRF